MPPIMCRRCNAKPARSGGTCFRCLTAPPEPVPACRYCDKPVVHRSLELCNKHLRRHRLGIDPHAPHGNRGRGREDPTADMTADELDEFVEQQRETMPDR